MFRGEFGWLDERDNLFYPIRKSVVKVKKDSAVQLGWKGINQELEKIKWAVELSPVKYGWKINRSLKTFLRLSMIPGLELQGKSGYLYSPENDITYSYTKKFTEKDRPIYTPIEFLNKFSPINEIWDWCQGNDRLENLYVNSLSKRDQEIMKAIIDG